MFRARQLLYLLQHPNLILFETFYANDFPVLYIFSYHMQSHSIHKERKIYNTICEAFGNFSTNILTKVKMYNSYQSKLCNFYALVCFEQDALYICCCTQIRLILKYFLRIIFPSCIYFHII